MKPEDILKQLTPEKLSDAMRQMGNFLSPTQMDRVRQSLQNIDGAELVQKLKHCSAEELSKELEKNPELRNNPELKQKLRQILEKK